MLAHFTQSLTLNQQHSYVESEEALFAFQPINQLYLVLIASKGSNVLQHLECVQLICRFISNLCDNLEEQEIVSKFSEIILALDEMVISGTFDGITLPQIISNLLMQSQEEELQELIEKVQINHTNCIFACLLFTFRIKFKKLVKLESLK